MSKIQELSNELRKAATAKKLPPDEHKAIMTAIGLVEEIGGTFDRIATALEAIALNTNPK